MPLPPVPAGDREGPQKIVYGPDYWNNNPTLAFLKHQLDPGNYNRLGQQASFDPKMGINLPALTGLNYGDMLQVLSNPVSSGLAHSAWGSSNRDFDADAAMAKQFAPIWEGSVYGNMIRT